MVMEDVRALPASREQEGDILNLTETPFKAGLEMLFLNFKIALDEAAIVGRF